MDLSINLLVINLLQITSVLKFALRRWIDHTRKGMVVWFIDNYRRERFAGASLNGKFYGTVLLTPITWVVFRYLLELRTKLTVC